MTAAITTVSVFAGFVLSDDTMIKQFGFVLAVEIVLAPIFLLMSLMS
ncbi:MAG: hypothetical protein ABIU87_10470 [Ornithinibacter sp.]